MAFTFQFPKVVGLPWSKLYFYQTGTSTPQDTYTTNALSVAHANPVEADSAGVFPAIYLDPTLPHYRVTYATSADVDLYTQDNVPSNQNVQQSMRLESTNPFVFLYDTDGTSNSRKYRIRAAGAAFEIQASNDAEDTFTTILRHESGVLYSNTTEVAVTSSGTFTGTLSTGFATPPTGTVSYRKINNVVTLFIGGTGITGTSNGTGLEMTGLPAALRPTNAKIVPTAALQDNSNQQHCGEVTISSGGTLTFRIARTDVTANFVRNSASGFTNSGGKGLNAGWSITYGLD